MIELKDFLAIQYDSSPENIFNLEAEGEIITDYQSYISRVNAQGKILFEAMAEGAVAQISRQTVLTVGKTVQDRISRVFRLLEEEFLRDELRQCREPSSPSNSIKYSEYKRDWSLLIRLATSYQMFSGSAKTFRSEDIDVAVEIAEKVCKIMLPLASCNIWIGCLAHKYALLELLCFLFVVLMLIS